MNLSTAQRTALKNAIQADQAANEMFAAGNLQGLADYFNAPASPDYIVWGTAVTRAQIYHEVSPEGTSWNWATYKAQGVQEQNAWVQMFMGDVADFSLPNLRAGVDAIFSGSGAPATQRAHVAAAAKRKASRGGKVFATGNGAIATPSTLARDASGTYIDGNLSYTDFAGL